MTAGPDQPGPACHRCGYDLRAQPADGRCPEYGGSVAEAICRAAVSRRMWHERDPRWRRAVLAGVWVLAAVPLAEALARLGGARWLPGGARRLVADTAVVWVWPFGTFLIGAALLFTPEPGVRPSPTRRWGLIACGVVAAVGLSAYLAVAASVMCGVAARFASLPLAHQPAGTGWLLEVGSFYVRRGPLPSLGAWVVLIVAAPLAVLLGCRVLLDALRSCGRLWVAWLPLAPLVLAALAQLAYLPLAYFDASFIRRVPLAVFFFDPAVLLDGAAEGRPWPPHVLLADFMGFGWPHKRSTAGVELAKWLTVLAVAARLGWAEARALLARRPRATPSNLPLMRPPTPQAA